MRLTRLTIDAFRAIKRADVEFGPGLNILFGPNDLGKSTIATAIRAALLVPPSSSEAHSYGSWYASDNPRVELTLVDADGHYWKVKKTFGTSSSSSAELLHSKDAVTFTQDCKARQVEERLRAMLAWGIPGPGGKGAPRGVPTSFLASVLLAEQTDADGILRQSITEDSDDSGKLQLTKALSALAQDPLFKEVLRIAQREVDLFFTETGKRKRGQSSRFKEAGDQVRELNAELEGRKRQLEDSSAIEEEVTGLREARSHALVSVDEAQADLAAVERRSRNSTARSEISERLAAAKDALARIDVQITRLNELTAEFRACEERVKQQETDLAAASVACDASEARVRAAEEGHRVATSEDSAREQELRRAQLSERASDLTAKQLAARGRKSDVEVAIQAREEALRAHNAVLTAKANVEKAFEDREEARGRTDDRARELEVARAILAFVRWRAAIATMEATTKAIDAASSAKKEADNKDAEAAALETKAGSSEENLLKKSARLPTVEQSKLLLQLERDLEKAEAALGGGISVAVRSETEVAIRAAIDRQPSMDEQISADRVFEAERTLRLAIGDLVEIDITAGSSEKRRAVEQLRMRWRNEALPLLSKAKVKTRSEIDSLIADQTREQSAVADLKRGAERLRAEAKSLRDQAKIHEEKAGAGTINVEEVEARKAAIGAHDVQSIEEHYGRLSRPPESKAELLHQELARIHRKLQDELATFEEAVRIADYQLSEARKRAAELDALQNPSMDLDALQSEINEEILLLDREKAENASQLGSLVAEASREVQNAQRALLEAQEAHREAKESRDRALAARDASRADYNAYSGALGEMHAQIKDLDRNAAELAVKSREVELAAFPIEAAATVNDVELARNRIDAANREHDRAKEALNLKEGALSRVGGAALREEVDRLEEARVAAEARERELEVDADAWKFLRDTLREVENEEGAHLGRALAGPVTARFEELTAGRYRGLRLDAALKAEAIEVTTSSASGDEVLEALSVGTRGQLAALIRLTIADQIRSTIILDDHLVHTDRIRLDWFRDVLQKTAINTQVIVLTCRAEDYLSESERPVATASTDVAAGTIRAIDVARVLTRFEG